jgi:hypothetical protein|tara:strand:+ start:566 stop:814 length:249 start_codon:yes stop_codon:yes gene_type:complete
MRNYNIKKFKGNTHYSVRVVDTYGREKGNFFRDLQDCYKFVYEIWDNEQPLTNEEIEQNLLSDAIANCIKIDKQNNINLNLD